MHSLSPPSWPHNQYFSNISMDHNALTIRSHRLCWRCRLHAYIFQTPLFCFRAIFWKDDDRFEFYLK
jgi:hypothetical protein